MKNNKTNPKFLCDCQSKYGNECMAKYEYCECFNYYNKDKLFCEECIGIVKQVDLECNICKYRQDDLNLFYPYPGYCKDDCNEETECMCGCNCDECQSIPQIGESFSERSCGYCYDHRRKIMDEIRDIKMKENEATKMPVNTA